MKPINLFDLYSENKLIEKDFFKDFQKLYRKSDFTLGFQDSPVEDIENIFLKILEDMQWVFHQALRHFMRLHLQ